MTQLDFDHAYLARDPRDTSVAAAIATLPRSGTARRRVYDAIGAAGPDGLTDEEIVTVLAMSPNTARPRRLELVESGLVIDSTLRRPTYAGLSAIVWIRTP